MRIISGSSRGARLVAPPGEGTRPLTDLMRGAIFSRLGETVVGTRVLDLFAGTGAFGLEAWSRGAAAVTLVEQGPEAIRAIETNKVSVVREQESLDAVEVVRGDVFRYVEFAARDKRQFDLIFAGPPYAKYPGQISFAQKLLQLPALMEIVSPKGYLVLEHFKQEPLNLGTWQCERTLRHGQSLVEILRPPASGLGVK